MIGSQLMSSKVSKIEVNDKMGNPKCDICHRTTADGRHVYDADILNEMIGRNVLKTGLGICESCLPKYYTRVPGGEPLTYNGIVMIETVRGMLQETLNMHPYIWLTRADREFVVKNFVFSVERQLYDYLRDKVVMWAVTDSESACQMFDTDLIEQVKSRILDNQELSFSKIAVRVAVETDSTGILFREIFKLANSIVIMVSKTGFVPQARIR